MEQITQTFRQFVSEPEIKTLIGIFLALLTYLFDLGNPEMWLIIGIMVALDTATGVVAAWKRDEAIKSAKMFRFATKVFVYGTSVALINVMARACACTSTDCPEGVATILRIAAFGWIVATEGKSINENFASLGYPLPEKIEKLLNGLKK